MECYYEAYFEDDKYVFQIKIKKFKVLKFHDFFWGGILVISLKTKSNFILKFQLFFSKSINNLSNTYPKIYLVYQYGIFLKNRKDGCTNHRKTTTTKYLIQTKT
jgi:hypothetical protein